MANPLKQFEIKSLVELPPIMGQNIDFTNSSLFMVLAATAIMLFLSLGVRGRALVPGRYQSMVELSYSFVANTVKDTVGSEGRAYFPFIFTLFMFVLFCNLFGMIPFSFTVTSHIIVTFALAAVVFLGVTFIAIFKHGFGKFIRNFLPHGTPLWLAPLIFVIEIISYLARPISLSIRLAANMMAGHVMLKVIAGYVFMLGLLGIAPFLLLILLTGFEIFVAILQAYIFTVLTCVYLNDALHLH
jgi:F-type H+-transporting ATPase subunit a